MMRSLRPFGWPILFILIGFISRVIGAVMIVADWPGAAMVLIVSTLVIILAMLWVIVILILLLQNQ